MLKHRNVYFWTFTEPGRKQDEAYWTKDEAEKHFKPFKDLVRRRGGEYLVVWQLQKRGSWHPHVLTNQFIDVNWLRAWMVARGWGQQMRVERVVRKNMHVPDGHGGWKAVTFGAEKILHYLTRYLMRGFRSSPVDAVKKKCFGGTHRSKCGTVKFCWDKYQKAGAWLYAMGKPLFIAIHGRLPKFSDMAFVIRLGVEDTGWADVDPLWEFGVPSG